MIIKPGFRPHLGIIIINWNSLSYTLECLKSLYQSLGIETVRCLVIDNGSEDANEIEVIQKAFPHVHTLRNKQNKGFTGAHNQGFRWAEEQGVAYIMILNNDTVVDRSLLTI